MGKWTKVDMTDILKQDVQDWIKIVVETKDDINPGKDNTGELSRNNRLNNGFGKWFLMGSFGNKGQINRNLANYATIQSKTPVLIIAVSTDASNAELRYRESSEDELKASAREIFDLHEVVEVIIDGQRLDTNDGLVEVATDVIDVEFPENNVYQVILDAQAGPCKLFCIAWAVEIKFEPGDHEIEIISSHPESEKVGVKGFNQNVKYRINVE
jgi:hypothetical protein